MVGVGAGVSAHGHEETSGAMDVFQNWMGVTAAQPYELLDHRGALCHGWVSVQYINSTTLKLF